MPAPSKVLRFLESRTPPKNKKSSFIHRQPPWFKIKVVKKLLDLTDFYTLMINLPVRKAYFMSSPSDTCANLWDIQTKGNELNKFVSDGVLWFHFDVSPFSANALVYIFPLHFILQMKLDVSHFLLNIHTL